MVKRACACGSTSAIFAPAAAATIGPTTGSSMTPVTVDSVCSCRVNWMMGMPIPTARLTTDANIHSAQTNRVKL